MSHSFKSRQKTSSPTDAFRGNTIRRFDTVEIRDTILAVVELNKFNSVVSQGRALHGGRGRVPVRGVRGDLPAALLPLRPPLLPRLRRLPRRLQVLRQTGM